MAATTVISGRPTELDRTAFDVITATSKLQLRAADVRMNKPNWKSYLQGGMVSQEDYNFITKLEALRTAEDREVFLDTYKYESIDSFLNLMTRMSVDQTVGYVLTMIDDILQENQARVELFNAHSKKKKRNVWEPFLDMLSREDGFIVNQVSRIIAKIACWSTELMDGPDLMTYLTWLKDHLKMPSNEYVQTSARCLQMMTRIEEYRYAFANNMDGIQTIISVLSGRANFQLQYQLIFCLWCLTFSPPIAEKMGRLAVVPVLADILSEATKEKVQRIILATLRNLLEKIDDKTIVRENALQMVQGKVMKSLEFMQEKKIDDAELVDDIEFLTEQLHVSVQDLSSFDEYCTEVKSGMLQWSPVHKSEKFWRENAQRFNEMNFEILKILVKILEVAQDPLILCVAAHDIGEYVRHYPRGKTVIEQLQAKQLVMRLLTHDDPNVRYQALLAVQKIMVHNWEYLGKSMDTKDGTQDLKTKYALPGQKAKA